MPVVSKAENQVTWNHFFRVAGGLTAPRTPNAFSRGTEVLLSPRGLKPKLLSCFYGTAKAMP